MNENCREISVPETDDGCNDPNTHQLYCGNSRYLHCGFKTVEYCLHQPGMIDSPVFFDNLKSLIIGTNLIS